MGLSKRTVERRIKALEKKKFLRRLPSEVTDEGEPTRRRYELSGFIEQLDVAASVGLTQRNFVKQRSEKTGVDHKR
jgi:hypothetical protein